MMNDEWEPGEFSERITPIQNIPTVYGYQLRTHVTRIRKRTFSDLNFAIQRLKRVAEPYGSPRYGLSRHSALRSCPDYSPVAVL